jgi:predicted dehydrogenase
MNTPEPALTSRRDFIRSTTTVAAASALAGLALPAVHAAGSDLVQVALIGCGGRGADAAQQALKTKGGPVKLVAMADIFEERLKTKLAALSERYASQVEVPADRQFIGFEAYQKAMDCLKPGDVAIFTTPPAFRWVHFSYAIQKSLNVFMEKPVTVDGPTTKRMIALGEEAKKKNLKVGVGLMVRHCRGRQQLFERIQGGEIGEIVAMRGYRMGGRAAATGPKPANQPEAMFQTQRFHSFLWASGGVFSDYYIHQIDECSWMKGAWPVKAHAVGGRHYRDGAVDQNLDVYAVQYVFPDDTRFYFDGRNITGCHTEFASYAEGTKGSAIISTASHTPGRVRTFKSHTMTRENMIWAFPQPEPNPYQTEWDDLMDAIRNDKPYNEVKRGAEASLVTSMGRMAAHTGQIITFEDMLNCPHEFAPGVDKLTPGGPAPLQPGPDGKYPVPQPGILKDREYLAQNHVL